MTIFSYKRLPKNPEIGNTLVWLLSNIWRLGQVRDTKLGTNVFKEKLLNAAKCQGYSYYGFWVIKEKLTGGKIIPTPRLGLNSFLIFASLVTSLPNLFIILFLLQIADF